MFGNLEPALHAHVVPRHADEPGGAAQRAPTTGMRHRGSMRRRALEPLRRRLRTELALPAD
ncbi:MAG: hypothetical protein U1F11_09645 [Steroidobacteraceae bacterium]